MTDAVPALRASRLGMVFAAALAIAAAQTGLALAHAHAANFREGYGLLLYWDGCWFWSVAAEGYSCPPESREWNVAFFPGYPCCARLLTKATGLDQRTTMPLTAQLASAVFWAYLLLFFLRWGVRFRVAVFALLVVATHPAAFYLVVAYSESVFLAATVGFFYWASSGSRVGLVLAAGHGFLMTSTRMVGAPLVVVPLLQLLLESPAGESLGQRARRMLPLTAVAAVAACGVLGYFAYCQIRFGHWDAYLHTEEVGWGVHAEYFAIFRRKTYHITWPHRRDLRSSLWLDHLAVVAVATFLAVFASVECWVARTCKGDTGWRWRCGLYSAILLLYYVTITGRSCQEMVAMIRYSVPLVTLFVLAACHLIARVGIRRWVATCLAALLVPWMCYGFVIQMVFVWCFTTGMWVA